MLCTRFTRKKAHTPSAPYHLKLFQELLFCALLKMVLTWSFLNARRFCPSVDCLCDTACCSLFPSAHVPQTSPGTPTQRSSCAATSTPWRSSFSLHPTQQRQVAHTHTHTQRQVASHHTHTHIYTHTHTHTPSVRTGRIRTLFRQERDEHP